ncbi:MAG: hypothetical protein M3535_11255, partial [Actinomycetota bacterium]|nr:hypothetical protein [Actinomycetota bacterium]
MVRRFIPLVLALTTLLAACSSSPDPQTLVSSASQATTESGRARMFLETKVSGLGVGGDVTTTGEGLVDFESQSGNLTLQLPSIGQASPGDVELA